jgi:hypothetical protein
MFNLIWFYSTKSVAAVQWVFLMKLHTNQTCSYSINFLPLIRNFTAMSTFVFLVDIIRIRYSLPLPQATIKSLKFSFHLFDSYMPFSFCEINIINSSYHLCSLCVTEAQTFRHLRLTSGMRAFQCCYIYIYIYIYIFIFLVFTGRRCQEHLQATDRSG